MVTYFHLLTLKPLLIYLGGEWLVYLQSYLPFELFALLFMLFWSRSLLFLVCDYYAVCKIFQEHVYHI